MPPQRRPSERRAPLVPDSGGFGAGYSCEEGVAKLKRARSAWGAVLAVCYRIAAAMREVERALAKSGPQAGETQAVQRIRPDSPLPVGRGTRGGTGRWAAGGLGSSPTAPRRAVVPAARPQ